MFNGCGAAWSVCVCSCTGRRVHVGRRFEKSIHPPPSCTLMSLARLSRELISRPSLQACRQEITFWVSMRPGRIVSPDRLPWKYCVNLGVATSPPSGRGDKVVEKVKHGKVNGQLWMEKYSMKKPFAEEGWIVSFN